MGMAISRLVHSCDRVITVMGVLKCFQLLPTKDDTPWQGNPENFHMNVGPITTRKQLSSVIKTGSCKKVAMACCWDTSLGDRFYSGARPISRALL